MKRTALRHLLVTVAGSAAALVSMSVLAAPGDLYEADAGSGTIFKFAQDGTKSTFASGLSTPSAVAFDGSGNLFEADYGSGTIFKFTPSGTRTTFASDGLSGPYGLAFDSAGNLFVADLISGTIFKFTPSGTRTTFASGLNGPNALAFDSAGNLFESDQGSGTIFKFTPTGTKSPFASGLNLPVALAFDSAGNLFESDNGSNTIFKFTPSGTRTPFIASGLNSPAGLAFDSAGNLFESDNGSGTIFIFTPSGFPFASGLSFPNGLAFEPVIHQLRNISTRGLVGTGENVLIGGFIVGGNGMVNGKVLIRALGPTLTGFGIPGALQDPTLQLFDSSGGIIATNNNWKDTQQSQIKATGLAPPDDRESAIFATLPAGNYTAIVRGASDTTGVALVEVYNVQ